MNMVTLFAAFSIGLLGSGHCLSMCGGIAAALTYALPPSKRTMLTALSHQVYYALGRIATYSFVGMLAGSMGVYIAHGLGPLGKQVLQGIAGLITIALGLYISGWWLGLRYLEQLGQQVWKILAPLNRHLMPITSPSQALILGMLWGWLPCGLVYSTVTWAVSSGAGYQGGILMLSFGVGTLPALLVTGTLASRLRALTQHAVVRGLAGLLIILLGGWQWMSILILHAHH